MMASLSEMVQVTCIKACSHKKSVKNQSQSKNRKINNIKLVVASKNLEKTLDPKKKAFYLVATLVSFHIINPRWFSILFRRNNRNKPSWKHEGTSLIVLIGPIHKQVLSNFSVKWIDKFSTFWRVVGAWPHWTSRAEGERNIKILCSRRPFRGVPKLQRR